YIPPNTGAFGSFGVSGVFQGAVMVFFAYCGFDAVSCASQEAKNPQYDVPVGILTSLGVAAVLYVAVGAVLTGIVSYRALGVPHPLAVGIAATGQGWLETTIEVGAVVGLASVLLLQLYGQTRVFFAMAHDGLLPRAATRVHPVFGTPHITTWAVGLGVAILAGLLPVQILGELTSIGTLFAFSLVSIGVLVLRLRRPDLRRPFRVPGGPYLVPLASLACSGLLMTTATPQTLARLFGWMAFGLCFYGLYSYRRSALRAGAPR
ncbi:MAG TPA: amino acid permease, partial [Myxococcota bacterium]|nr:amino acid permease [Myxococcota bacterium]